MKVYITKETNGYDNSCKDNGQVLKTAWGYDKTDALLKASIMANFFRDDNGQTSDIVWDCKL